MKQSIVKTIIFVGFLLTILGVIIDPLIAESPLATVIGLMTNVPFFIAITAVLGTVFIFSKRETLAAVGYGLVAFVGAVGVMLLTYIDTVLMVFIPIGLTVMFVGSVLQCVLVIIEFFGFTKQQKSEKASDSISSTLIRYKELEKDGVLSEEEFANLKGKTFAADDQKITSFDDLKKWKKLLDQNVITEEEFAALKAKLFAD